MKLRGRHFKRHPDTGPLTSLYFWTARSREHFKGKRKIYKRKVSCFQNGETFAKYHNFLTVLWNTSLQMSSVFESLANYIQLQGVRVYYLIAITQQTQTFPLYYYMFFSIFMSSYLICYKLLFMSYLWNGQWYSWTFEPIIWAVTSLGQDNSNADYLTLRHRKHTIPKTYTSD